MTCSSLDILGMVSAVFYVSAGIKGQRMDGGRMVEEAVFMGRRTGNGWG